MARKPDPKIVDNEMERLLDEQRKLADRIKNARARKQAIRDQRLLAVGRIAESAGIADLRDDDLLAAFRVIASKNGSMASGDFVAA